MGVVEKLKWKSYFVEHAGCIIGGLEQRGGEGGGVGGRERERERKIERERETEKERKRDLTDAFSLL